MHIQTYPYMDEPTVEITTANQRSSILRSIIYKHILTVDPYVGRALCRSPLIGGLAGIQTLVLHCDSVNMEAPVFW